MLWSTVVGTVDVVVLSRPSYMSHVHAVARPVELTIITLRTFRGDRSSLLASAARVVCTIKWSQVLWSRGACGSSTTRLRVSSEGSIAAMLNVTLDMAL